MSLTLKLASLAIRTLAKPVGNSIKSRAREHETFRHLFIRFAQSLHRVDMRMRLGILHDAAAQERMHARELAEQNASVVKKKVESGPNARNSTTSSSNVSDETKQDADQASHTEKSEKKVVKPKIRPLSEARAIELGANFASESFIFLVAAGLLIFERWWSRRKETLKDEHFGERLRSLEEQAARVHELENELENMKLDKSNLQLQKAPSKAIINTKLSSPSPKAGVNITSA